MQGVNNSVGYIDDNVIVGCANICWHAHTQCERIGKFSRLMINDTFTRVCDKNIE